MDIPQTRDDDGDLEIQIIIFSVIVFRFFALIYSDCMFSSRAPGNSYSKLTHASYDYYRLVIAKI
jgi:hypothetical protein